MKIKFILFALSLCLAKVPFAYALSWSFNQEKNFDQIIISKNTAKEKIETIRIDTNKILIQGKNFSQNLQLIQGNIISDVLPTEYGLTIVLKNNAFGFMQNTDKNGNIIVGIYKDPMGARWKPTKQRINFNNQVSQKEETVKVKLKELKEQERIADTNTTPNSEPKKTAQVPQADTTNTLTQQENPSQTTAALQSTAVSAAVPKTAEAELTEKTALSSPETATPQLAQKNPQQAMQDEKPKTAQKTAPKKQVQYSPITQEQLQELMAQQPQISNHSSLADYILSKKNELILVAEAPNENPATLLEKAETIKPNELLATPQQNQTNQTTQANQAPNAAPARQTINAAIPSVTLKLNTTPPSEVRTITKEEIKQHELEEQVTKKDKAAQTESPALIQKEEQGLPLVIEDKEHDTMIPQSPDEIVQINAQILEQQEKQNRQEKAVSEDKEQAPGEIIYVDEAGNEIPAPLDIPATIQSMRQAYNLGIYETVYEEANKLKGLNLPKNLLEEIYYNRAKAFFVINSTNLKNAGETFISLAQEALNVNDESSRKPELLANLVATYLEMDRPTEARAYTDILYKTYPYSIDTPNAILLLSDYLLQHQEYTIATQYLQILIDKYPDNTYAKNAAMLQIKTIHKLGNFDRTLAMIHFIDRRWPKVYLEFPDYLIIKAHILEEQGQLKEAISTYWQIFNLNPQDEQAGDILFKIANLYYEIHQNDTAKKVLEQLYQDYPKHKSAPKALLYMGENGRYDDRVNIDDIIAIFKEPNPEYPANYYHKIINEYPDSEEALIATLRLATLKYIEKDYLDAAKLAQSIFNNNIDKFESESASELLYRAFDPLFQLSLSEQNYERTLLLWENFPAVHKYYEPINSEMRLAMAKAYINRDNTAEAERLLSYFLERTPSNELEYQEGIYAYDIFLAHALNKQDWNRVLETNKKVDSWALPIEKENNKKYTTAIAAENIGLEARALPLWQELAANESIPLYQRAYAQYFLARDAERKQNIRGAYQANLDALAMFEDLRNVQSPYASTERERESIAALMDITEIAGRFTESLEWLNHYRNYIAENSTDYAGLQLREARLHRKMGDTTRWKSILEDVRRREPESIYGKMASSELNTYEMARDLTRFTGNN